MSTGVGKGTQAQRLLQRFPELSAISSGDLLRDNVKNRTPLGARLPHFLHRSNTNGRYRHKRREHHAIGRSCSRFHDPSPHS